jgi:hypothetical protein
VGVESAFAYLIPYVLDPSKWKKEQITGYKAGGYVFPGLAGVGLKSAELATAFSKIEHDRSPWIQFVNLLVENS